MVKHLLSRVVPFLLASVLVASAAFASEVKQDPKPSVLRINGEEVAQSEYYRRLEWLRIDPTSPLADLPAGFLVLRQIINEQLRLSIAKEQGVLPTAPEIDAEYQTRLASNPKLLDIYAQKGLTGTDLKAEIRNELADFKLRTRGITITDQEVDAHYKAYPSEFTTPKTYRLRVIVVNDPELQKAVDADLAAGKKFPDVAKARSLDDSASQSGLKGELPEPLMPDTIKAAVAKLKVGGYSEWVGSAQNPAIKVRYQVDDIYPAKTRPLDSALRKEIRRQILLDRGNIKNKVGDQLKLATVKAKFEFANPEFQKLHDQLVRDLSASIAASGTPQGSGGL